jgi:hypothetical protein
LKYAAKKDATEAKPENLKKDATEQVQTCRTALEFKDKQIRDLLWSLPVRNACIADNY